MRGCDLSNAIVILLGPSGCGKSYLSTAIGASVRVSVDDFYRGAEDPEVPRWFFGQRAWADPRSIHLDSLLACVNELLIERSTSIPIYSMLSDTRLGERRVEVEGEGPVVVEGYHALQLVTSVSSLRSGSTVVLVTTPRWTSLLRRLRRDIGGRKQFGSRLLFQQVYLWNTTRSYEHEARKYAHLELDGRLPVEALAARVQEVVAKRSEREGRSG